MLGYTGLNCLQPTIQTDVVPMLSSSICAGFQAKAAASHEASRPRLTGRSTRTSMLRMAAG